MIKKAIIVLCAFLFSSITSYSQNFCGRDSLHQALLNTDKAYKAKSEQIAALWQDHLNSQFKKVSQDTFTRIIPVVFHIIHDNGPENIPDSLIYEQVDILNESFRKISGTPGDGAGVDTKIEFCLATLAPNGNPTTGITRTQTPCTDITQPGCGGWPKNIIFWGDNGNFYLNIWIRKNFGYLGLGGPSYHIEVRYDCIGRNSLLNGRVVVHEAGHVFTLDHTFEGGCGTADCATSGDYICDTPPVAFPNSGCGVANTCSTDTPDLPDQKENYMDYTHDVCQNMFTQGQKEKMLLSIDNRNLSSELYLMLSGCSQCDSAVCPPFANFKADKTFLYIGDTVNFTDLSVRAPTSWQWSFPGGVPSTSTVQNPTVRYDTAGYYTVTLIISNAAGSDSITFTNYMRVLNKNVSTLDGGLLSFKPYPLKIYNNELYVGGGGSLGFGPPNMEMTKWSGTNWDSVGTGTVTDVYHMEVYKNELYVTSDLRGIYKWDGSNWDSLGHFQFTNIQWMRQHALIVFNNELYIGGDSIVMKWDGTTDSVVGVITMNNWWGEIYSMAVYNNELYVGGVFDTINGIAVNNIAKFDGTNWYPVGSGINGTSYVMHVYNNELYVGGNFDTVGGVQTFDLARWDGANWSSLGFDSSLILTHVRALEEWNNKLYVGGVLSSVAGISAGYIARWDGTSWTAVIPDVNNMVKGLKVYNNELYASGWFTYAGIPVNYITKWGCDSLTVGFAQSNNIVDLAVSGNVIFTNQSINAISIYWEFGDGATDTIQNPVHIYWQEGTYTVTLTATNDVCANSYTSTVVVTWGCSPLGIGLYQNKDTVDLAVSGDVEFFSQVVYADSMIWDFGDGITDTAENPTHTYTQSGTYTVTLTGFKDTCSNSATSTIVVIGNVGVEGLQSASEHLQIYPNPNTGEFTLEIDLQENTELGIKLYHFTGQLIYSEGIGNVTGNYTQQIDLSKNAKGIYYVQVVTDGVVITKKVIYQ